MTVHTDPRPHLSALYDQERQTPVAPEEGPELHRARHAGENVLEEAFNDVFEQLPHEATVREAFEQFKRQAYEQGAKGIGILGASVRFQARDIVERDQAARQDRMNELCGGGRGTTKRHER